MLNFSDLSKGCISKFVCVSNLKLYWYANAKYCCSVMSWFDLVEDHVWVMGLWASCSLVAWGWGLLHSEIQCCCSVRP